VLIGSKFKNERKRSRPTPVELETKNTGHIDSS
jgi:hypothetical protein